MQIHPESRECPGCHFKRIPYAKVVTKNRKHWVIYTCSMCKLQDIDFYFPKRVWTGKQFEEESLPDEDSQP